MFWRPEASAMNELKWSKEQYPEMNKASARTQELPERGWYALHTV